VILKFKPVKLSLSEHFGASDSFVAIWRRSTRNVPDFGIVQSWFRSKQFAPIYTFRGIFVFGKKRAGKPLENQRLAADPSRFVLMAFLTGTDSNCVRTGKKGPSNLGVLDVAGFCGLSLVSDERFEQHQPAGADKWRSPVESDRRLGHEWT
jgi:hypothetical protein